MSGLSDFIRLCDPIDGDGLVDINADNLRRVWQAGAIDWTSPDLRGELLHCRDRQARVGGIVLQWLGVVSPRAADSERFDRIHYLLMWIGTAALANVDAIDAELEQLEDDDGPYFH